MLNIFQYRLGLQIIPVSSITQDEMGELQVLSSDGKLYYHNGTVSSAVVTEDGQNTVSNTNFKDNSTFIIDNVDGTIRIGFDAAGTTGTTTTIQSSQTANRTITLPDATDTLVGRATTDTLTNKSISGSTNTLSNIANTSLSNMAAHTIKGNNTGSSASPSDLTGTQVTAELDIFVGDSGSGGTKGLVPAPASGDSAAGKFLKADGTWAVVAGGGIVTDTGPATLSNKNLVDNSTFIIDNSDGTIRIGFDATGTTSTTTVIKSTQTANRTLSLPDITDFLITRNSNDTLTNKLLETANVKFTQTVGTRFLNFDLSSQSSFTTLTLNSLASTSQTISIPDKAGGYQFVGDTVSQILTNKDYDGGTASNTSRLTVPKAAKATLDGLTRKQATIVYASDQNKLYSDNGTSLVPVGSGGSGGINFISLDSTFQPTQSDSVDAENTVGNWLAYADAAGTAPVDMTGGSPVVTIARTTIVGEVLDGAGSFKVVKDAANRQGNGVSVVAYIPLGYRGQRASITMPFKVISGSLVQNDLKLYAYDITNAQVLTPEHNDVISSGILKSVFDIPATCSQIRFGFHFASTSTTAVTFSFDDVTVGPQNISTGSTISDWVPNNNFVPNAAGWGTVTYLGFQTRRVGDSLHVVGEFRAGTVSSASAKIALPPGFTIDPNKLPSVSGALAQDYKAGSWARVSTGVAVALSTANVSGDVYVDENDLTSVYLSGSGISGSYRNDNANTLANSNDFINLKFEIPIAGWSSNTTIANSGIIRISEVLANGTRVTSTPSQLGEYRTLIKDNAASTYSDTSPSSGPTVTDGMKIFSTNGTGAGTSGQPNRWQIFIGKNKSYRLQTYSSTGRTGRLSIDYFIDNSSNEVGLEVDYDPTTGIIDLFIPLWIGNTTRYIGVDAGANGTSSITPVMNGYFDVIVADNDFQIQLDFPNSEIRVDTFAGYGSTNNKIVRFTNVAISKGNDITYVSDATLGDSFVINTSGRYACSFMGYQASGADYIGISLNTTEPTVSIIGLTNPLEAITFEYPGVATAAMSCESTLNLNPGDVIRAHTGGTALQGGTKYINFRIVKV